MSTASGLSSKVKGGDGRQLAPFASFELAVLSRESDQHYPRDREEGRSDGKGRHSKGGASISLDNNRALATCYKSMITHHPI